MYMRSVVFRRKPERVAGRDRRVQIDAISTDFDESNFRIRS